MTPDFSEILFKNHPLSSWVYSRESLRFLRVNLSAVKQYGYSEEEFLAMRVTDLLPAGQIPTFTDSLSAIQTSSCREWWTRRQNNSFFCAATYTSDIQFEGRSALFSVIQDISAFTHINELEPSYSAHPAAADPFTDAAQRKREREHYFQTEKMEAVARLAGGIAHDFNNLVTVILGYGGLLAADLAKDTARAPERMRSLDEIRRAGERAASLAGQLLAFSRKQVVSTDEINLNATIAALKPVLSGVVGGKVQIELALDPDLGPIRADPDRAEQVLMNLAVNARDAMPNGGLLTIETRNVELTTRYSPIQKLNPGSYIELSVTDTGHGMNENTRARVFEPFFTTKGPGRGTGLGLPMVYSFVKQSGGTVSLYSEPGRGACFKLYLPRAGSAVGQTDPASPHDLERGTGVILVVEDETGIRKLMHDVLSAAGYQVVLAASTEEALEYSAVGSSPIDLLISDVVLPGLSGPELADAIRLRHPNLRILFVSGYSDYALIRQGTMQPGAAFLHKPFDMDALVHRVHNLLLASQTSKSLAG